MRARVVTDGIEVDHDEPGGEWLPVEERRPVLKEGQVHTGPSYDLVTDDEEQPVKVLAVYEAADAPPPALPRDRAALAGAVRAAPNTLAGLRAALIAWSEGREP